MNKEYPSTDIPVSSLTYALKGQKLLEQKGFRAWAGRDHDRVQGCGYKLTVKGMHSAQNSCCNRVALSWRALLSQRQVRGDDLF